MLNSSVSKHTVAVNFKKLIYLRKTIKDVQNLFCCYIHYSLYSLPLKWYSCIRREIGILNLLLSVTVLFHVFRVFIKIYKSTSDTFKAAIIGDIIPPTLFSSTLRYRALSDSLIKYPNNCFREYFHIEITSRRLTVFSVGICHSAYVKERKNFEVLENFSKRHILSGEETRDCRIFLVLPRLTTCCSLYFCHARDLNLKLVKYFSLAWCFGSFYLLPRNLSTSRLSMRFLCRGVNFDKLDICL